MTMENGQLESSPQTSSLGHSLVPVVSKLQNICALSGISLPIDLPHIAVVGGQSSGKSSVLEALVGRDFLPRGCDICTRRPLVLQLLQTKAKDDGSDGEEYGEFLHLSGRKFYDFGDIRREIQAETEREAGPNKAISDKPIRLKVYSPNVLDMTLVDLPGITRVPVGDQPSDIEAEIRTMILQHISPLNCIILAVTPANYDLANSDALQIAGNVDPDGSRTIGVITKLDIMDRGTDARNLLLGKIIPLQLGYIGVVNRSQEDIDHNRSIKDALLAEEKFFRSHPVYVNLADRCGVPQLAKKLNQILVLHIRQTLPELKSRISSQLISVSKEYASYGQITESRAGQGTLLLNILSKFAEAFSSLVEGKSEEMCTSELSGGARIHYIFQSIFVKSLEEFDPCEDLSDEDICTAIHNARGPRSQVFVPDVPFELLVRRQIARLLDPSLQCARFIYNELIKMSHRCMVNELQRFPVLRKRVDEVTGKFLWGNLQPAESIIGHIVEMEMDFINTSHQNFIGGTRALEAAQQQVRSSRDSTESDSVQASERNPRPRGIIARSLANGFIRSPANGTTADQGARTNNMDGERNRSIDGSVWGISSIFSGNENHVSSSGGKAASFSAILKSPYGSLRATLSLREENHTTVNHVVENHVCGNHSTSQDPFRSSSQNNEPVYGVDSSAIIHLREAPAILRSAEAPSEQDSTEIAATKLLLTSYFDIVRKNIEDLVPKAIMHFLVNHTKRELHNVLIENLYRENLFEEMLQEPQEVAVKRKHARETLRVLQQAFQALDELPLEANTVQKGYSLANDSIGLPRTRGGLPSSSFYVKFTWPLSGTEIVIGLPYSEEKTAQM